MSRTKLAAELIETDGRCSDPGIGRYRTAFIEGLVDGATAAAFRDHTLGCMACGAEVANAQTKARIAEELGVDPTDPSVTAGLRVVRILTPRCPDWRHVNARLLNARK